MKYFLQIGFSARFFRLGFLLVFLWVLAAWYSFLLLWINMLALGFVLLVLIDFALLFGSSKSVTASRKMASRFSNGDDNIVEIECINHYPFNIYLRLVDEIPIQFQLRNFHFDLSLEASQAKKLTYKLRPVTRGVYHFGNINLQISNRLGLVRRHLAIDQQAQIAVYPSFHQLKRIELLSFAEMKNLLGFKKIRNLGYNQEFEQVKDYVIGDEIKHINWNATARKNNMMVNQFQDEKSQHVYCLLDMGRTLEMPFNGMSLLDYSINACLAISQIILKNNDEAGLITYDKKIRSIVPARKTNNQLHQLLETLYGQKTAFEESTLEPVYSYIQNKIRQRSLLIFFINFESIYSLKRNLPLYTKLSKSHLVLLVNYKNTEIVQLANQTAGTIDGIYQKTIAENFLFEKRTFLKELSRYGIYTLFAAPEDINIATINKYLEIKARGLL